MDLLSETYRKSMIWLVVSLLGLLVAGCGVWAISFVPTATPEPMVVPVDTPTIIGVAEPTSASSLAAEAAVSSLAPTSTLIMVTPVTATKPPAFPTGKLVGVWHAPKEDLADLSRFGINAVFFSPRHPGELVDYLETAEKLGMRVIVNLVRSRDMVDQGCLAAQADPERGFKNCPFDPEAFRIALEQYRPLKLARFADTSLYAHMMLDEPFDSTDWGGSPIPEDDLRQASAYSREILGETVPTAFNAGYIPATMRPGLVDLVTSSFYANKEARFGSVEAYLADQMNNLAGAWGAQPDLQYILLLQAFGGGRYGPFPAVTTMEAKATHACQHPLVGGVMWWAWSKPQVTDLSTVIHAPGGAAYIEMLGRVAQACGN